MSLARFGVRKPVPVNLLMVAILLAGAVSGLSLRREFFPESDPEMATVRQIRWLTFQLSFWCLMSMNTSSTRGVPSNMNWCLAPGMDWSFSLLINTRGT